MENLLKEFTNPSRRCKYCNGREVTLIFKDKIKRNLIKDTDDFWICSDKEECKRNQDAEDTEIEFKFAAKGEFPDFEISLAEQIVKYKGKEVLNFKEEIE